MDDINVNGYSGKLCSIQCKAERNKFALFWFWQGIAIICKLLDTFPYNKKTGYTSFFIYVRYFQLRFGLDVILFLNTTRTNIFLPVGVKLSWNINGWSFPKPYVIWIFYSELAFRSYQIHLGIFSLLYLRPQNLLGWIRIGTARVMCKAFSSNSIMTIAWNTL